MSGCTQAQNWHLTTSPTTLEQASQVLGGGGFITEGLTDGGGGGVPRGSPGEGEAVRLTDGGAQARREGAQRRRGAEEGSCSSTAEGEGSP
jgi:hypothetical protein